LRAKRVVFVIAPEGFNDHELLHPKGIVESEGIDVIVASTILGRCRGMRGAVVESATMIEEIDPSDYDGIVAVGGHGALRYLSDNESLINLFRRFNEQGKLVSAIGRARHALHNAGLFGSNFSWGPEVEINGNVIAARPPATTPGWNSKRFGHLLVEHLRGS